MSAEIASLTECYIKSTARVEVSSLEIGERGPINSRRWGVVDTGRKFILSDRFPKMVWIEPVINEELLILRGRGQQRELEVPIRDEGERYGAVLFGNNYSVVDDGDEAAFWLQEFLAVDGCRLVHMPNEYMRKDKSGLSSFWLADSWSMSLSSVESREQVGDWVGRAIPGNRFGHNIEVAGVEPFEEDKWQEIRIGGPMGLSVAVTKPIERCARIGIDREATTLEELNKRDKEPMATLVKRRAEKVSGKPLFGQKLAPRWEGENVTIHVGDNVHADIYKAPPQLR